MILAKISEVDPAYRVTTIFTGLLGQFCASSDVLKKVPNMKRPVVISDDDFFIFSKFKNLSMDASWKVCVHFAWALKNCQTSFALSIKMNEVHQKCSFPSFLVPKCGFVSI
jgi:hypothetical protein